MDNNLLVEDEIRDIAEIDYEKDDVLSLQRQGAIAVNKLVAEFMEKGEVADTSVIALSLVRFRDLQVRDYAMGLANAENKDKLFNLWCELHPRICATLFGGSI
ncbi:MAG: hypothetical protein EBV37_04235 [Actinobacteria bacterium]|nr:hypothetical protein [Actinomycetota bacterium]